MGEGRTAESQVVINNFSGYDWRSIAIDQPAAWLVASECRLLPPLAAAPGAGQSWQLSFRVNTAHLGIGRHSAEITVRPVAAEPLKSTLPVALFVRPPVAAVPSNLFFGRIRQGESVERKVVLVAPSGEAAFRAADVSVTCPQEDGLEVEQSASGVNFVRLNVRLTPIRDEKASPSERVVEGKIIANFKSGGLPDIAIPYQALLLNE